ncbi:helix-turn-helix domain-containing protein [Coxiella burnetii]|nr:hypothetical protein [Coxiella burnetii]MCF2094215.1 helix-turn-helix domain-containing protein [Coxiella burnetii]MCF2096259.1 helix-turn-helix domain-containing protein [Coxiella burnetii]MCF2098259.1 helix-turn-helix domain-containing protein [Coxiella burnetii]MCF2100253.1 helix-turn-helix domain-containing protein [Coxiella burnetii]MCF2102461.1 helix-turn-helix domain-containing protein [Coxiella burnetii]
MVDIFKKLNISKSTLYKYLRHRNVPISYCAHPHFS